MTKVFAFDTNTIISAHLLPSSLIRKACDMAFEKGILVHSNDTIAELADAFTRPKFDKYISLEDRLKAISLLENRSQLIEIKEPVLACRDPGDDKFLALALAADADCIVTGDKDLLILESFRNIPILNPAEFLSRF